MKCCNNFLIIQKLKTLTPFINKTGFINDLHNLRPVCVCVTHIQWSHLLWTSVQLDLLLSLCCKTTADQPKVLTSDAVYFELASGVKYLSCFIVGVSVAVAVVDLGHKVCTSRLRCPVHMCTPSEFRHFLTKPVVAYRLCLKLFY